MIQLQGKAVSVITGDLAAGWVIVMTPDGNHYEVPPESLCDGCGGAVSKAVLALVIGQATQCIGFAWICMVEHPPCAPYPAAGFPDEEEARRYAAKCTISRNPARVVAAHEFLRARSRWWQQRQPRESFPPPEAGAMADAAGAMDAMDGAGEEAAFKADRGGGMGAEVEILVSGVSVPVRRA